MTTTYLRLVAPIEGRQRAKASENGVSMLTHVRTAKDSPANGVTRRLVPGPLAPERCVTLAECVSQEHVVLVGRDSDGIVRVKVELAAEDVTSWWFKLIRHWLARHYRVSGTTAVRPALELVP
jgi:hypothetical protein